MTQFIIVLAMSLATLGFQKAEDILPTAFKTGNTNAIMELTGDKLDLAIEGQEKVYSREQASLVLKEFFKKHPPTRFKLLHVGTPAESETKYHIGELSTENGDFRITYYTKEKGESLVIDQIRIDAAEE